MLETPEPQAAVAEWHRLAAEPAPADRKPVGCLAMIGALVAAFALPAVLGWVGLDLARDTRSILAAAMALVFVGGLLVWLFSQGKYGRYAQRAEAALAALAEGQPALKDAVALIFFAHCSDGPSLSLTIKTEAARGRLGPALPYVVAVEQALLAELKIYPVFTSGTAGTSPATPPATPKA